MLIRIFLLVFFTNVACADHILVSAATGALGSEIAKKFASEGYNVVLLDRSNDKLIKLKKELEHQYKINVQINVVDYNNFASTKLQKLPRLSGAVIIPPRTIFKNKLIPEAAEWQLAVNEGFIGPLELIRNITDNMNSNSSIVIISGVTSKSYMPNYPNTNVIKQMWGGEVKNLCNQFAGKIRFNVVSPGVILTDFNKSKITERGEKLGKPYEQQLIDETSVIPSRQYGKPEDVSSFIHYLIINAPSYLNCDNIALDGGINASY